MGLEVAGAFDVDFGDKLFCGRELFVTFGLSGVVSFVIESVTGVIVVFPALVPFVSLSTTVV